MLILSLVLSNALVVAILPHKAVLSAQPQSCSAVTMLKNFPVLIRINNTLMHSQIPTSCPGIVGTCLWGPPGAAPTYRRMSQCSRILPHRRPGTCPRHLRMKLGASRVQQGWGTILVCTVSHSRGTGSQPGLSRYPGSVKEHCFSITQRESPPANLYLVMPLKIYSS